MIGLRGKAALSKKWFATRKFDLGGGGAKFTYQLFGGVGVMVSKKIALIGGFRDLYVDKSSIDLLSRCRCMGQCLGFKFQQVAGELNRECRASWERGDLALQVRHLSMVATRCDLPKRRQAAALQTWRSAWVFPWL